MDRLASLFLGLTALIHVGISVVEMFFWTDPKVYERLNLGLDENQARAVAPIVQNAGLYNAFLAAGLIWGLFATADRAPIRVFFLACVIIAGVFGAITLKNPNVLALQTLPAAVALVLAHFARSETMISS